ncbi:MAG TPA: RNA polymerase sigma factor [Isosphaeraceae bacterium]|jgi:RNA polymerase sigma factor (sigma-70 family)|nr:RNA polymerase sigma factor [Isosphaeraceae bacterium]
MTAKRPDSVVSQFQVLIRGGSATGLSDEQLLERFVARRDEVAFGTLVSRHGPMVFSICRDLLGNLHDAEDAFQATFLVLARKAASIQQPELLGAWLYGVALRAATKARAQETRRRRREGKGLPMTHQGTKTSEDSHAFGLMRREAAEVLHDEIGRLPARYRGVVLLCYFQGQTHEEAARRLRRPVGTISVWLSRARERLRGCLVRRGLAPAGLLGVLFSGELTSAAMLSRTLVDSTVRAATQLAAGEIMSAGVVSASVASLTESLLRAMMMTKLRMTAMALLAMTVVAVGGGVLAQQKPEAAAKGDTTNAAGQGDRTSTAKAITKPLDLREALVVIDAWQTLISVQQGRVNEAEERLKKEQAQLREYQAQIKPIFEAIQTMKRSRANPAKEEQDQH